MPCPDMLRLMVASQAAFDLGQRLLQQTAPKTSQRLWG